MFSTLRSIRLSLHPNTLKAGKVTGSRRLGMAHSGTAHKYSKKLIAFEHAGAHVKGDGEPNTLLWIGGLGDGLVTVQ